MTITQILPIDKKRSRIWLDEEFAFVLYKGELRRFNMGEGGQLSEKDFHTITEEIIPKRAKLRAMNLLKSRSYSENQLRRKLEEGYYSEDIIDDTVDYLYSFGYLDDGRICEEYIRIHLQDKSRMRIRMDLLGKGISAEKIDDAFRTCSEEGFVQDEIIQAVRLLEKKGYDPGKHYERGEIMKFYAFLARKGFSSETIRSAIKNIDESDIFGVE